MSLTDTKLTFADRILYVGITLDVQLGLLVFTFKILAFHEKLVSGIVICPKEHAQKFVLVFQVVNLGFFQSALDSQTRLINTGVKRSSSTVGKTAED